MSDDRWVVLALGHPRAGWFRELAKWATSAAIPVDVVKCVSADEARVRIAGGRAFSAMLAGADSRGLDRDLIDTVRGSGAAMVVVAPPSDRDWAGLGVDVVLDVGFERHELLATLRNHSKPIARIDYRPANDIAEPPMSRPGRLVAVTGPGGTGASVTAMAIAQAFAGDPASLRTVLLADLCLDAEQGMLHDAREVMPGLPELTDAHRSGRLTADQVRSLTFDVVDRGYQLLLGLRRHRDWTAIRPRAFAAALEGLLSAYTMVVADVDADIEGEDSTGSIDVEDRNAIARATVLRADLVVVVGSASTKGLHSMTRVVRELHRSGVPASRIVPVCALAARDPRRRAEATKTLDHLLRSDRDLAAVGNPVFLPERNDVERSIRDGVALPFQLGRPIHAEIRHLLDRTPPPSAPADPVPEPVVAGSIGSWSEDAE